MTVLTVLLLILLAAALWWRWHAGGVMRQRTGARAPAGSGYQCVSVRVGLNACRAAQGFERRRFLPNDAPALPLPGCDERRCECRYLHHADRRDDERRDPYSRLGMALKQGEDRRRGRDRRRFA